MMSFQGKRELLAQVAPRYCEANRKEKSVILNEFIASTGYARKYAIRLLTMRVISLPGPIRRPRARRYGKEVQEALTIPGQLRITSVPKGWRHFWKNWYLPWRSMDT